MNMKFNLTNLIINVPDENAEIKIGNMLFELNDLNLKDYLEVLKEVPSLIREVRAAIEEPSKVTDQSPEAKATERRQANVKFIAEEMGADLTEEQLGSIMDAIKSHHDHNWAPANWNEHIGDLIKQAKREEAREAQEGVTV